jgi:hypothetical protein
VQFKPDVTFDIRDGNWTASADVPEKLGLLRTVAPRGSVEFLRVQQVIENPCGEDEIVTNPGAADLLAKLQTLPHLTVSEPVTVRVGGSVGRRMDISVADSSLAACGGLVGGGAALFRAAGEVWSATPGERFTLVIVAVGNDAVTIAVSTDWTQTPSVQELEGLNQLGQRVLDSVRF